MRKVHPLINHYIEEVCTQVKARQLREEIKEELVSHLEELMESRRLEGNDDEEAARWAIKQMGDSSSVAEGMNQVHKPRTPWGLLSALVLMLFVSLFTLYAAELSYEGAQRTTLAGIDLFAKQGLFIAMGVTLLFAVSRIRYQVLLTYCRVLYGGTVLFMLASMLWGQQLYGALGYFRFGPFHIDVMGMSPFLLMISAAGMLYQRKESLRGIFVHTVLLTFVPLTLFATAPSFTGLFIYASAYSLLLLLAGCNWRWFAPHLLLITSAVSFLLMWKPHSRERLLAFIHPSTDSSYLYLQINEAIRSAGWRGHGFGAVLDKLPSIHSETIFTYIIYSMGWVVAAAVLLCVLFYIVQLFRAAILVRDPFGKMLISGLGALFTVQCVLSIGMSIGVLPLTAVTLPIISYGGSGLLLQLTAAGVIYSVYRRKDLMRTT